MPLLLAAAASASLMFGVAQAHDLPSAIDTLRQAGRVFQPPSFFLASCTDEFCRSEAPEIGTLLTGRVGRGTDYTVVCRSTPSAQAPFPVQIPKYSPRTIDVGFDASTIKKLFPSETIPPLLHSLLGSATLEARGIYREFALGERNLRRAVFSLPPDCMAAPSSRDDQIIVQRDFGKLLLRIEFKSGLSVEELTPTLLQLKRELQADYHLRIGTIDGKRILEIETKDLRHFSFRTASWNDIRIRNPEWFNRLPHQSK